MNRPLKVFMILGAVVAVAGIVHLCREQRKSTDEDRLDKVADEGYETAYDVLYPNRKFNRRKQHYGPVFRS